MKKLHVAISGVHGTGKTTLFRDLQQVKTLKKFTFVSGITRELREMNISINEQGDDFTQTVVLTDHWRRIDLPGNVIYERFILDGYAYTKYLYQHVSVSGPVLAFARDILKRTIAKYDIIYYVRPEFALEEDGIRAIDTRFQDDVLKIFEETIKKYNIKVKILIGSPDQRIDQFLKYLKEEQAKT